VTRTGK